ncbi:alpha/beta hydrolase [Salinigranum rubrum]|uniref:Alpha/beta hydrolase n=1 Tax=Salinigranum rubrum TaxID=755307 RepID=A0A2I8VM52_9EURY|nr:dienelactone hydrolase family protein [Salinigranum rubrum]AUV83001.1 alpha/beta hydrolase [Salinigranum rubrum]
MDVLVSGGRDVRATLDGDSGDACVVACPPHPQHRGSRTDERLRAVSRRLVDSDVDCLRIDYGPWAEGKGEVRDAANAVAHARDELGYARVGLFGYSFGGAVSLVAATECEAGAVSVLAPARRLSDELDAVSAVKTLSSPLQVVYGARDTTVEWEPVVEAVRERGGEVVELPADHFFVGQAGKVADEVGPFLVEAL